uniref:Uncharacterized protein n=1 Tax=Oryctolagus cuniculus TaxID=9986 RepID=A0A5F9CAQ8_RABIT
MSNHRESGKITVWPPRKQRPLCILFSLLFFPDHCLWPSQPPLLPLPRHHPGPRAGAAPWRAPRESPRPSPRASLPPMHDLRSRGGWGQPEGGGLRPGKERGQQR